MPRTAKVRRKMVHNRHQSGGSPVKFVGYIIPHKLPWGCSQGGPYKVVADKRVKVVKGIKHAR